MVMQPVMIKFVPKICYVSALTFVPEILNLMRAILYWRLMTRTGTLQKSNSTASTAGILRHTFLVVC